MFQHTAARRRLDRNRNGQLWRKRFQHTAARRRLFFQLHQKLDGITVSTHSRPKAAAWSSCSCVFASAVSTHSRPKAADGGHRNTKTKDEVSTHSRPKAAVKNNKVTLEQVVVSTHSRPKAAEWLALLEHLKSCFNTQPPEGGWPCYPALSYLKAFQHTAARRRLQLRKNRQYIGILFQHTAARRRLAVSSKG